MQQSKKTRAYLNLARASEDYLKSKRTDEDRKNLLRVYEEINYLQAMKQFNEAFCLVVTEEDNPGEQVLVLNAGENRPNESLEIQIRTLLHMPQRIADWMLKDVIEVVRNAGWNGATPGEVGAFLLSNYGAYIRVEYRTNY